MRTTSIALILLCLVSACQGQEQKENNYKLMGRCEGCEAVFEYGNKELQPVDTLPEFENNEPKLKLTGTIYRSDGKTPASDVILYIYHTDKTGKYPTKGNEKGWAKRHGYIRGWIKTDESGIYTFYTFKPGSYSSNPAHIHATILEPNGRYYYIEEYNFIGDPNLQNAHDDNGRGGSGLVELQKKGDLLVAERDIILGLNVPGYQ